MWKDTSRGGSLQPGARQGSIFVLLGSRTQRWLSSLSPVSLQFSLPAQEGALTHQSTYQQSETAFPLCSQKNRIQSLFGLGRLLIGLLPDLSCQVCICQVTERRVSGLWFCFIPLGHVKRVYGVAWKAGKPEATWSGT